MKFNNKNTKYYIAGSVLAVVLVMATVIGLTGYNPWASDDEPDAPTPLAYSTFELTSAVDGEDVSSWAIMDIWVPKSGATFEDGYEDITALTTNFEREETGKDADDISIDLSIYPYVWAEIAGTGQLWQNHFELIITGGINRVYRYDVHDPSNAAPFNIYERNTGANITLDGTNGIAVSGDANFTGVVDATLSYLAAASCHYGDNWDLGTTDFAALTNAQQEVYWNQREWADQFPTYDPTMDTNNEFERDFEALTNVFCVYLEMNASINVTDGAAAEVNVSLARGQPIEIVIAATNVYFLWYEGFNFLDGPMTWDFEMSFAANITILTAYSGRIDVPASATSLTDFVVFNEIGLVAA